MYRLSVAALAVALAACAPVSKKPVQQADLSDRLSVGCYTVDLFDPYRIEYPAAGVSPADAKFLGVWKDAAWNGNWCHDLYITEVRADGSVTLLDAYGPNTQRGWEAQVFKRNARIVDGALTFTTIGRAEVTYRLQGDFLVGKRTDFLGTQEITMGRTEGVALVPVPPRNPRRG